MDSPSPDTTLSNGNGRRRLMDAALRLAARKGSVHAIGVRELGREADLNANTFYRHFADFDALGLAIMQELAVDLRNGLRQIRRGPVQSQEMARSTVRYVFDYARRHRDAFMLGMRELHGASPTLRAALRGLIDDLAADMVEDIQQRRLAPELDPARLQRIGPVIVRQTFYMSLEALESPTDAEAITDLAAECIDALIAGEHLLQGAAPK